MQITVRIDGREETLDVTRSGNQIRVTRGDETFVAEIVRRDPDGLIWLASGNRLLPLATHRQGDRRQLWVDGKTIHYERVLSRRDTGQAADVGLAATIPAVVTELLVEAGDRVTAGDKLILLESMKMVIPITAPYSGRVTALHCAAGDAVQPGRQLVDLEPTDA